MSSHRAGAEALAGCRTRNPTSIVDTCHPSSLRHRACISDKEGLRRDKLSMRRERHYEEGEAA